MRPRCAAVCPVDCCVDDENYRETVDQLMDEEQAAYLMFIKIWFWLAVEVPALVAIALLKCIRPFYIMAMQFFIAEIFSTINDHLNLTCYICYLLKYSYG